MKRKKILFVAMHNSPHTARWINLLAGFGWDLHLFAINEAATIPLLSGVTVHRPIWRVSPRHLLARLRGRARDLAGCPEVGIYPLRMPAKLEFLLVRKQFSLGADGATRPLLYGPRTLLRLIEDLKPDLIHSMEFQHCGYLVAQAKALAGTRGFPPWLVTNWGSDIYYYRHFSDHLQRIREVLSGADFYSCECERDVGLARELGFDKKVLPVLPNTGGFDLTFVDRWREVHPPAQRRLVMVKGYQHFAGRALTALDALERCAQDLKGYRIVIFSPSQPIYERVNELQQWLGLDIVVLPHATHDAMLRLFARARLYIGISISDAISTSMLEAMALGCFPIQTGTACADEWIEDGVSGLIVDPDAPQVIAEAIRRALRDDALVEQAAVINCATVRARLDQDQLRKQVRLFYDSALENSPLAQG
ncbi:glycosyltransferase [Candidatus Thiodictyon syntrophicum]|nr:glycosyltransferase [Candidatus Thiodictyon syntrophicum]